MPLFRTHEIGTIDYSSGQKKSLLIDRDGVLTALFINLQYTVTNSATPAVGPLFQTLARLISRLDFTLAGKDNVVSMSGAMLAAQAHYDFGVPMKGMDDTVVLTGSAATTYRVSIPILRYLPRSINPVRTADDLRKVSQAVLEITWANADATDFYTTPNAAAISAVTCWVEGQYLVGDIAANAQFQTRVLKEISEDFSSTNTDRKVTIDNTTGQLLRSVSVAALRGEIGSAAPLPRKVKFNAGPFVFHDNRVDLLQGRNRARFGIEAPITGFFHVPFTEFGDPDMMINTSPEFLSADLEAHFDLVYTSGTERLLIGVETVRNPQF